MRAMIRIAPPAALLACGAPRSASGFAAGSPGGGRIGRRPAPPAALSASPLGDFLGGIFGGGEDDDGGRGGIEGDAAAVEPSADAEGGEMGPSSFRDELERRRRGAGGAGAAGEDGADEGEGGFDGYDLRDIIYAKWEACYDVEFQRVDSYGVQSVYLNIMPFKLGRKPFRHETEMDYLCHLQAVIEILVKYNQLEYVLMQMGETNKKPRAGTSPLIAVPLRLDLTPEQVGKILG